MNELNVISNKYFNKERKVLLYGNIDEDYLNKIILCMKNYEAPDIVSVFDGTAVGMEHFEFDSYKNTKKGSDLHIQNSTIKREFDKYVQANYESSKTIIKHDEIKNTSNSKFYFKNFEKVFKEHYKKVDKYIENISNSFGIEKSKIDICFFAEDTTILGSAYKNSNGTLSQLLPIYSIDILNLLKMCPKIKFIIFGFYNMKEYDSAIFINNIDTIEEQIKNLPIIKDEDFFSMNPKTTGYAEIISKEEMEKLENE